MSRIIKAWTAAVAVLLVLGLCSAARAQIPPEKQAQILMRALSYDSNLRARAGGSVVIAVLFKPTVTSSEPAADITYRAFKTLEGVKVQDLPLRVVKLAYTGKDSLKNAIAAQGIDALYCSPGLDADISALREVSHQQHVVTLASREQDVQAGLSIGVFSNDGQIAIVINLPAVKEEGASLSTDLLRLATVLR